VERRKIATTKGTKDHEGLRLQELSLVHLRALDGEGSLPGIDLTLADF
jgi:hypothetical protein